MLGYPEWPGNRSRRNRLGGYRRCDINRGSSRIVTSIPPVFSLQLFEFDLFLGGESLASESTSVFEPLQPLEVLFVPESREDY